MDDIPSSEVIISHCKRGEHWSTFDPTFEFFTFLNKARLKYETSTDIQERALGFGKTQVPERYKCSVQ